MDEKDGVIVDSPNISFKFWIGLIAITLLLGIIQSGVFSDHLSQHYQSKNISLTGQMGAIQPEQICLPNVEAMGSRSPIEFEAALSKSVYEKYNTTFERACLDTDLCKMGTGKYGLSENVFVQLPELTNTEIQRMRSLSIEFQGSSSVQFVKSIEEKYWKQPEFFDRPDMTFEGYAVPEMLSLAQPGRADHAGFGYGFYKGQYLVMINKPTDEIEVSFFVKADWGVKNFQGMQLSPAYPSSEFFLLGSYSDGKKVAEQDPEYAECHIRLIDIDPKEFALEPAYPTLDLGYVKKVTAKFKVQDLKPGKYAVNLVPSNPSDEFSDYMRVTYPTQYIPVGAGYLAPASTKVSIFIEVSV